MDIVCEACEHELHPHPPDEGDHHMGEVKYPLDYGIGIFHQGTFPGYPPVSSNRFNGQFVVPDRSVHCSINALGI